MPADRPHDDPRPEVGLCGRCRHAIVQASARGSLFWRCAASEDRGDLRRYPPLPVRACPAHVSGEPRRTDERRRDP